MISHRGNVHGINLTEENKPSYIVEALRLGFDVEIDVWRLPTGKWWLGHDEPQHPVNLDYLMNPMFWCHAKNSDALNYFREHSNHCHFFWHQHDDYTITSRGVIWVHSTKHLIPMSVCVLPELGINGDLKQCYGICSDFIERYKYQLYDTPDKISHS